MAMSARARGWPDDPPDVTAQIGCGGQRHRITWRRGKLVVEDHDVLAERSLTALGAELPLCVQILDAWRQPALVAGMVERLLVDDGALDELDLMGRRIRYEIAVTKAKEPVPGAMPAVGRTRR